MRRRHGVLAAGAAWAIAVTLLDAVGQVPLRSTVAYTAYLMWVVVLPGTVVWRLADSPRRVPRPRAEDLVLGSAVGLALELPTYLLAALAGMPRAVAAWPLAPLALLWWRRRRGRSTVGAPPPTPWRSTWGTAGVLALVTILLAHSRWAGYPADALGALHDKDEAFHLALTGELMHHVPHLEYPYVAGTPLQYHWGVYVHLASASWLTGVDPAVIVRTLAPTALVALTLLVAGAVASRIFAGPAAGTIAVALAGLASLPDVFGWTKPSAPLLGPLLPLTEHYASPSQAMACVLLLPTMLLAADLLREGLQWRRAVLLCVMLAALTVVKSPFPLLVTGGLAAAGAVALARRRGRVAALALFGTAGLETALLAMAIYGGSTRSMVLDPLQGVRVATGYLLGTGTEQNPRTAVLVPVLAAVLALLGILNLGWVLLVRRHGLTSHLAVLLGGWATGTAAWLVLGHVYYAEQYFLHAAGLLAAVLAAGALALSIPDPQTRHRSAWLVVLAAVSVVVTVGVGKVTARLTGAFPVTSGPAAVTAFVLPVVLWSAVALGGWVLLRRHLALSAFAPAAVLVLALASTVQWPVSEVAALATPVSPGPATEAIGADGVAAARWLRDHSGTDDLVATNAHCYSPTQVTCTFQNFWIAGFAERRILVEGWGYVPTPATVGTLLDSDTLPFWDPTRLADNDAAFTHPSSTTVGTLVHRYGVRWLMADLRFGIDLPGLADVATVRHRAGDYVVLQLS